MYSSQPRGRTLSFGSGASGPPPRDIIVILGALFVTYSLQFFGAGAAGLVNLLRLTPEVWQHGFLWQLATYGFVAGPPQASLWFLLSLLIIFWFGRDVHRYLGKRQFRLLLAWTLGVSGLVSVVVHILLSLVGGGGRYPFVLMEGQNIILTIMIAAFATVYGNATIYLFFILPIKARWFLGLEILFAFMAFLPTMDLAGFLGICTAVGFTYTALTGGNWRRFLREWRLRLERKILEARLKSSRRRSGLRVVKPEKDDDDVTRGPWVH